MRNKKKQENKFVRAQTPEMIRKQRAAIISYYTKKRNEEPKKKH